MIELQTTLKSHNNSRLWSVDWYFSFLERHPQQNLLAAVGEDKMINLWKQNGQKEWIKTVLVQSIVTEHLKTIRCIKFSNKGDKIAVCSFDSLISIYILNESAYEFLTQLQGHQNQVKCIDWHQTDKKIASCSRDKNIWIWQFNPTTYEYECENILEGHTNDVKCVKWIDYSTLVSCSYDDTIRVWAQNDDDFQEFQVLKVHQSIVWSVEYRNGILISCSTDLSVVLFKRDQDSQKFSKIQTVLNLHEEPIYGAYVIYPYFLTSSGDNTIKLSRCEQEQKKDHKEICTVFHSNDVNCIRLIKNEDHFHMASCSDDGTLKIWKVKI